MSNIYKGSYICGPFWAELYGRREGWWYTWDHKLIRKATVSELRAGDGIY